MDRGIGIGHKFIKIQIGEHVVQREQGLVARYHTQQPQWHRTEGLAQFHTAGQSAKTTNLPRLTIGKLQFLIIEITFQKTTESFGIVQHQGAIIVIDIGPFHPIANGSLSGSIDDGGIDIELLYFRCNTRKRSRVHIIEAKGIGQSGTQRTERAAHTKPKILHRFHFHIESGQVYVR